MTHRDCGCPHGDSCNYAEFERYVDEAKRAGAGERVAGESLAAFITRMLEEKRELRSRIEALEEWTDRLEHVLEEYQGKA